MKENEIEELYKRVENIEQTIKYYENLAETNKSNIVPKEDYQNMPWIDESNEHLKEIEE